MFGIEYALSFYSKFWTNTELLVQRQERATAGELHRLRIIRVTFALF